MANRAVRRPPERYARPLFLATIIIGSFLLFVMQPMVARMALPRIGGAPAVWNSAMLVYQALLLGGYAYAHWLARLAPRRQAGVHIALFVVAALMLPIGLSEAVRPTRAEPALWVPWFLISSIGPLFFIVSSQAPLMQRWYALESARGEPYVLYAASNLGSFAGLISYPLLAEPLMTLRQQSLVWTWGYILLALMVAACAWTLRGVRIKEVDLPTTSRPEPRRILHWVALAAVPSGLMLSTTTHLTTDIVAVPLLWVVPLGLYLLSFVVAFSNRRGAARFITLLAPVLVLIAGGLAFSDGSRYPLYSATLGLLLLFGVAVALHSEMYRLRPAADRLTGFYLAMSVGGMIGGLFCAIVAPILFDWAYEHPLLVLAAALLVPQKPLLPEAMHWRYFWALPLVGWPFSYAADKQLWPELSDPMVIAVITLLAVLALLCIGRRYAFAVALAALMMSYGGWSTVALSFGDVRTRSYFGIYSVRTQGDARILTHGTTMHGIQNLGPGEETYPTSYYAPGSGVGQAMSAAGLLFGPGAHIGVVGLGTGTLSCYARPDQVWRFFEIDPAITAIARDPTRFSFLSRCAPQATVVLGDARLAIADQPSGFFDILAVDAFTSDAIPMHLLTREAIATYGRAMQPEGILLVHISNRYIDLKPVVAAAAHKDGWSAALLRYTPSDAERRRNATLSVWIAMSRSEQSLDRLIAAGDPPSAWEPLVPRPGFAGWTDDHSSILPLLKGWTDWP